MLEQALHDRHPVGGGLVHHSDRGVQYVSIKYTGRLAEAGLVQPAGSVGDSYDNALAKTINGLYKAEVIWRRGPWRCRSTFRLTNGSFAINALFERAPITAHKSSFKTSVLHQSLEHLQSVYGLYGARNCHSLQGGPMAG